MGLNRSHGLNDWASAGTDSFRLFERLRSTSTSQEGESSKEFERLGVTLWCVFGKQPRARTPSQIIILDVCGLVLGGLFLGAWAENILFLERRMTLGSILNTAATICLCEMTDDREAFWLWGTIERRRWERDKIQKVFTTHIMHSFLSNILIVQTN